MLGHLPAARSAARIAFLALVACSAPTLRATESTKCSCAFADVHNKVKEILFAVSTKGEMSSAVLYFEPAWHQPESQVTIQFIGKGTSFVTAFKLAPKQKPISSVVSAEIKAGRCDAKAIAKQIRVIRTVVPMTQHLESLIDGLWDLRLVPRPRLVVHLDATIYTLRVNGEARIEVTTEDHESQLAKWMDEIWAETAS